jgi:hypothetical protein
MRNARLAALAVLGAVAIPSAAQAYAPPPIIREIVDGCYGAIVVVCDVGFSELPVELRDQTYPVCVITCTPATVPVPHLDRSPRTCVAWTDENGSPTEVCA